VVLLVSPRDEASGRLFLISLGGNNWPTSSIVAILVAGFVLDANLYSTLGPILIVITAVTFPVRAAAVVIGMHPPTSPYCTMDSVHIALHFPRSSRVVLARAGPVFSPSLLRSPIAVDPSVISALPVLLPGLVRLLRRKFWLHGGSLGRAQGRRLSLVLGE
jgi:hypothetical protein